jgi:hypothetical protein
MPHNVRSSPLEFKFPPSPIPIQNITFPDDIRIRRSVHCPTVSVDFAFIVNLHFLALVYLPSPEQLYH